MDPIRFHALLALGNEELERATAFDSDIAIFTEETRRLEVSRALRLGQLVEAVRDHRSCQAREIEGILEDLEYAIDATKDALHGARASRAEHERQARIFFEEAEERHGDGGG